MRAFFRSITSAGGRFAGAIAVLVVLGLVLARSTSEIAPQRPAAERPRGNGLDPTSTLSRLALGSGSDQTRPAPIWDAVTAAAPDLFLFLGNTVRVNPGSADLTAAIAAAYDGQRHAEGLARLRATVPVMAIWNADDLGGTPIEDKTHAARLFADFWGIETNGPGLFRAQMIGPEGRRVQIILLDLISFASSPERDAQGKVLMDRDPAHILLGAAQWSWLAKELAKAADLRLICSAMPVLSDNAEVVSWGSFPRARERLFQLIREKKANGVVLLSGGRPYGALYRAEGVGPYVLFELSSGTLNRLVHTPPDTREPYRLGPLVAESNFGLVEVDWIHRTARLSLRNVTGGTLAPETSVPLAALTVRPPEQPPPFVGSFLPGG